MLNNHDNIILNVKVTNGDKIFISKPPTYASSLKNNLLERLQAVCHKGILNIKAKVAIIIAS